MQPYLNLGKAIQVLALLSLGPLKGSEITAQARISTATLKRIIQSLRIINVVIEHSISRKLGHYHIKSWGILNPTASCDLVALSDDKPVQLTLAQSASNLPAINGLRLIATLALIELRQEYTYDQIAQAVAASPSTVKRDLNAAEALGVRVTRSGSRKEGLYQVQSWGVFDKDALLELATHRRTIFPPP